MYSNKIMNQETKNCQNCKNDFTIEPDDFSFYEKIKVPPPTFCPECRSIRRLVWKNHRSLYKRSCDLCNKNIISVYNPESPFPVYCNECFYGDAWDPTSYAVDIDWSRPFLEQWYELWNKVPKFARLSVGNVKNSDYTNVVINSTDCYLSYSITGSEQILYSESIDNGKSLIDCYMSIEGCDSCYYSQGRKDYGCKYVSQCASCINCYFCFDCVNCQDCFMSSNLRNKKYVFRGVQLSAEEYKIALEKENLGSRQSTEKLFSEWKEMISNDSIHQYARIVSGENATGNYIRNAKNIKECFNIYNSENIAYGNRVLNAKDAYDVHGFAEGELVYECVGCSYGSNKNLFSFYTMGSTNSEYSFLCLNSNNLFGCFSLSKKNYFILNKQYEKDQYLELVERIKQHMIDMPYIDKKGREYKYGEFLPFEFSPHGYNETLAFDFFSSDENKSESMGYNWSLIKDKNYQTTIDENNLPDSILETNDSILNEIISCSHSKINCNHQCTKAFKIVPDELLLYRKMNIPIPKNCPNCRHYERLPIFMQPLKLWHRSCMCDMHGHFHREGHCENQFETSYAPERPEKVYCEQCYQAEVL